MRRLDSKILLCGDYAQLHNRIASQADFRNTITLIEAQVKNKGVKVVIGISRYNFFRLNKIVEFATALLKKKLSDEERMILNNEFKAFPVRDIVSNFFTYIEKLRRLCNRLGNMELKLIDDDLRFILEIAGNRAYHYPHKEKRIARLLGVVCEEAFIGPQTIVLDPYHRCNVGCVHCFVHNPVINHAPGFLDRKITLDKFKEIMDDAAELKAEDIILQGDGEPLLHPDFLEMIRYVRKKKMKSLFFTNGCFLDEKIAREVIGLGISQIYCSLPAGSEKTYEEVCPNSKKGEWFNVIVENMKRLMDIKREKAKRQPILTMTHVIHKLNYDELIKMAELDVYIGTDSARFYLIRLDKNNRHLKLNDEQIASIQRDLPVIAGIFKKAGIEFVDNIKFQLSNYDNDTGSWSKDVFLKEGCHIGWCFCLIPAVGDISMCCHLRTVGYLDEKRFKEIWQSDYYRQRRYEAKFMSNYKDVEFLNGMKLYDEHCTHCDNHQNLLTMIQDLKEINLYKFLGEDAFQAGKIK